MRGRLRDRPLFMLKIFRKSVKKSLFCIELHGFYFEFVYSDRLMVVCRYERNNPMTFTSIVQPEVKIKHLDNMAQSLVHRINVAKANHNESLVAILEREYHQILSDRHQEQHKLTHPWTSQTIGTWAQQIWDQFADTIPNLYQLKIQQQTDDQGHIQWQVNNPKTGQTLITHSKPEMDTWIRQFYWNA